jgi:uncharacterized membrane protein YvbJ
MKKSDKYRKYINELLQDSAEWKLLTKEEQERLISYMSDNEDTVAEVLHLIIKEKELN